MCRSIVDHVARFSPVAVGDVALCARVGGNRYDCPDGSCERVIIYRAEMADGYGSGWCVAGRREDGSDTGPMDSAWFRKVPA